MMRGCLAHSTRCAGAPTARAFYQRQAPKAITSTPKTAVAIAPSIGLRLRDPVYILREMNLLSLSFIT